MPTMPGTDRTDADLVVRDFAVLFDRHAVLVHRYLARRIGVATADDLLAQTFLVAYEGRAKYDRSRPDARPWLYGIATNLLRRHQRDEVRQYQAWARTGVDPVFAESHAERVAERADADAWSGHLAAALAELKPADREVLLLFAWCELSYPEIADALDIPVGTVRSRLHRARGVVRAALPNMTEGE
ncbi:MAG: RNA polymerase subunit sigma-70 [Pseudonocardiales bacterium]|nr:MAG: RNA polymerase subunit sigma-70 [Pseudonocardiales bacterium]